MTTGPNRRESLMGLAALGLAGCAKEHRRMGFSNDGVAKLEADLKAAVASGQPPGLVGFLSRGDQTHIFPVGAMSIGGAPVPRDAIFRLASMTKPVTAVAAWMLIEEGRLRLDAPIDALAPELANRRVLKAMDGPLDDTVPANRPITLEDVMSFRLGWGIDFAETPFTRAAADVPGFGMPNPAWAGGNDAFMAALGKLPLMAQPGEKWLYTLGADVLGVLVARASGQSLGAFFQERIFGPLGMKDTGFWTKDPARLITGYVNDNGKLAPFEPWNGLYAKPPAFEAGDSGLVSTADDFGAFARMLFTGTTPGGKRLVSTASLKAMTTNVLTPEQIEGGEMILGPGRGWGLGVGAWVAESPHGIHRGAFGWDGGFGTSWFNDPAKDLVAILLTQRVFDGPDPPPVHKVFWKDAYAAVAG